MHSFVDRKAQTNDYQPFFPDRRHHTKDTGAKTLKVEGIMELTEAIRTRRSIRGYKSNAVARETLAAILDIARLSPSAVNHQPWEFIVLTGEALEMAKQVNVEQAMAGTEIGPDFPTGQLPGIYRERQIALAKDIFRLMDIGRDDKEKREQWQLRGLRFFDAPAVIIVCLEDGVLASQNKAALFDLGIVSQSIALLALEYGLGTCIQRFTVSYSDALKRALDISESKRFIATIAVGYPDWDFPANAIRSSRETLESLVTWKE